MCPLCRTDRLGALSKCLLAARSKAKVLGQVHPNPALPLTSYGTLGGFHASPRTSVSSFEAHHCRSLRLLGRQNEIVDRDVSAPGMQGAPRPATLPSPQPPAPAARSLQPVKCSSLPAPPAPWLLPSPSCPSQVAGVGTLGLLP